MPDVPLHQPHDKLFRATFSNPANTAAFLRHHLGAGGLHLPAVDWNSLTPVPGSFIEPEMAGFEADLLFSAKVEGLENLLYILWEHQRSEDALMGLRLLTYMTRIWHKQQGGRKPSPRLAPIVPIVLAQDKNHWKTSVRFHDLFDFPKEGREMLRGCTPDFGFRLLQLADIPYEDIRGTPEGILTLRSLKAAPLDELMRDPVWDNRIITGVSREAVERFFRYVLDANVDKEVFRARVQKLSPQSLTSLAMTLAETFRQEGRQEGEIVSRRQALFDVLETRFHRVPRGLGETIFTISDLPTLEKLLRTAVTCPDLETFASSL
jgi:predicted transposase YdaD